LPEGKTNVSVRTPKITVSPDQVITDFFDRLQVEGRTFFGPGFGPTKNGGCFMGDFLGFNPAIYGCFMGFNGWLVVTGT
jgi:hypothetical protein